MKFYQQTRPSKVASLPRVVVAAAAATAAAADTAAAAAAVGSGKSQIFCLSWIFICLQCKVLVGPIWWPSYKTVLQLKISLDCTVAWQVENP